MRYVSSSQSVFSPPAGGRQAEVTGASLCRIIGIAGSGWATDTAKLHNRTASRILMTIGVAKTIIANRPIASDAPQAPSQAGAWARAISFSAIPAIHTDAVLRFFLWNCRLLRIEPVCSVGHAFIAFRDKCSLFPWPFPPPIIHYVYTDEEVSQVAACTDQAELFLVSPLGRLDTTMIEPRVN